MGFPVTYTLVYAFPDYSLDSFAILRRRGCKCPHQQLVQPLSRPGLARGIQLPPFQVWSCHFAVW